MVGTDTELDKTVETDSRLVATDLVEKVADSDVELGTTVPLGDASGCTDTESEELTMLELVSSEVAGRLEPTLVVISEETISEPEGTALFA